MARRSQHPPQVPQTWRVHTAWRCCQCRRASHRRSPRRHSESVRPRVPRRPTPRHRIARRRPSWACTPPPHVGWPEPWRGKRLPCPPHPRQTTRESWPGRDQAQRRGRNLWPELRTTTLLGFAKRWQGNAETIEVRTCRKGRAWPFVRGARTRLRGRGLSKIFQPLGAVGHMQGLNDGRQVAAQDGGQRVQR